MRRSLIPVVVLISLLAGPRQHAAQEIAPTDVPLLDAIVLIDVLLDERFQGEARGEQLMDGIVAFVGGGPVRVAFDQRMFGCESPPLFDAMRIAISPVQNPDFDALQNAISEGRCRHFNEGDSGSLIGISSFGDGYLVRFRPTIGLSHWTLVNAIRWADPR